MGGYVPPVTPRYATSASPFEASEDFSVGAPSHRQQPNRVHQYGGYRSVPKIRNFLGNLSTVPKSDTLAVWSGGQATSQQGSVGSHLHPQVSAAPDRSGDIAHLIAAALPSSVHSQALSAVERRVADLESQVLRLTSELHEVRLKDRQSYERLKTRLDFHEKIMLRDPRYSREFLALRVHYISVGTRGRRRVFLLALHLRMRICYLIRVNISFETTHVKYGVRPHIWRECEPIIWVSHFLDHNKGPM